MPNKNQATCIAYFPDNNNEKGVLVIWNYLLYLRMQISLQSVHFNRLSAGNLAAGTNTNFQKEGKASFIYLKLYAVLFTGGVRAPVSCTVT